MRQCFHCKHTFNGENWICPACGSAPAEIQGFACFAPELNGDNSDYDASYFPVLMELEDRSFWFEARNRLVLWAVHRFFPSVESLLEIGAGTGYVTRALRAALPAAEIWASDIHVDALHCATERLKKTVNLFQMDARRIPFRAEFDGICLCDVLEHIDDDSAVLCEIGRALRPGGALLITVPQHMWLWGPADTIAFHKRRYGVTELEQKVRGVGFEVVCKTSFISVLLPFLYLARLRSRWSGKYDLREEAVVPALLDRVFRLMLSLEAAAIRWGVRIPIGGSQLLVAIKRA